MHGRVDAAGALAKNRPMERQRPPRVARAALGAMLAGLLAGAPARADEPVVYKWIDGDGIAHYTTQRSRIPGEYEDGVQEIRRSSPAAPPPAVAAPSPPAVAAPPPAPVETPPAVAAPPPAVAAPPVEAPPPRVTPEGEFEEAPLGAPTARPSADAPTPDAAAVPTPDAAAVPMPDAASPGPAEDVAAPPPGFIRGAANDERPSPPPQRESPPDAASAAPLSPESADELDRRIVALESEIEAEQSKLQGLLSEKATPDGTRIAEREDFREIAKRLPRLQSDLKTLREQRTRTSGL